MSRPCDFRRFAERQAAWAHRNWGPLTVVAAAIVAMGVAWAWLGHQGPPTEPVAPSATPALPEETLLDALGSSDHQMDKADDVVTSEDMREAEPPSHVKEEAGAPPSEPRGTHPVTVNKEAARKRLDVVRVLERVADEYGPSLRSGWTAFVRWFCKRPMPPKARMEKQLGEVALEKGDLKEAYFHFIRAQAILEEDKYSSIEEKEDLRILIENVQHEIEKEAKRAWKRGEWDFAAERFSAALGSYKTAEFWLSKEPLLPERIKACEGQVALRKGLHHFESGQYPQALPLLVEASGKGAVSQGLPGVIHECRARAHLASAETDADESTSKKSFASAQRELEAAMALGRTGLSDLLNKARRCRFILDDCRVGVP